MDLKIPVLGILLAAASALAIGMAWYSNQLFGKKWMKMIGLEPKDMQSRMGPAMGYLIFASVVTAYVLSVLMNYARYFTGSSWLITGISTAFWVWLGFALTTIIVHGVFEPRDEKVMLINAGNRLVTLLTMGVILSFFF